jgi:outer membrane protein assembly factor BamE (lipoprotein component of BamABCDE complex)
MNHLHKIFPAVFLFIGLAGCVTTQGPPLATIPARQVETQRITLGALQMNVKPGVSGDDVIKALGSPNIVTSNSDKTETWVYDKMMVENEVAVGSGAAVSTRSTRTMIVRIKFDGNKKVEDVSYRQMSY